MKRDREVRDCPKPGVGYILFHPRRETEAQRGESNMLEIIEQKPKLSLGPLPPRLRLLAHDGPPSQHVQTYGSTGMRQTIHRHSRAQGAATGPR